MILNEPVTLADNTTMDRSKFGLDLTLQDFEPSRVPMTDEEVFHSLIFIYCSLYLVLVK